jgi:hypothetical protein
MANYLDSLSSFTSKGQVVIAGLALEVATIFSQGGIATDQINKINWYSTLLEGANDTSQDTTIRLTLLTLLVDNARLNEVPFVNVFGLYQTLGNTTITASQWGLILGNINDQADLIAKFNTYLPLAGGTMTGNIVFGNDLGIEMVDDGDTFNLGVNAGIINFGTLGSTDINAGNFITGSWQADVIAPAYGGLGVQVITGQAGKAVVVNGAGTGYELATLSGGDVSWIGGLSVDNSVARFDSTTGKIIQGSPVIIGDNGAVSAVRSVTFNGTTSGFLNIAPPAIAGSSVQTFQVASGTLALLENNLGEFASTTSAQLLAKISDANGTGTLVFGTSPALTTPNIGVANGASLEIVGPLTIGDAGDTAGRIILKNVDNVTTQTIRGTNPTNSIIYDLPTTAPLAGQYLSATAPASSVVTLSWETLTALVNPMDTLGDIIYGLASGVPEKLAGNTTVTNKFLRSTGIAGVATAPSWETLVAGDIPTINQSQVSGLTAALSLKLGTNITQGKIYVGNISDIAAPVTPTGDWTMTYAGVSTISNNVVTFAKLQQASDPSVLIGTPSGTAGPQNFTQITIGSGLTMSALGVLTSGGLVNPMTAVGDLIVGGTGGDPTALAIGANTYVLTSNGTTAVWSPASGGGSGDVTGPASATSTGIATFDGTTGKIIQSPSNATVTSTGDGSFRSLLVTGTAGNGHLHMRHQGSAVSGIANSNTIYALNSASNGFGVIINNTAYVSSLIFGATTGQTYTFPDLTGTVALATAINAWGSGIKQTFAPSATTAGLNVGSIANDVSAPANGDLWYDSTGNLLRARINGATVSLGAGGGGGVTTMAAIGAVPNANGATISGTTLNLQPASASFGGVVTTAAQTFAGIKNFAADNTVFTTATPTQDGIVILPRAGGSSSLRVFITTAALTTSRTHTIPNVAADANFLLSQGNQTMVGSQTISFPGSTTVGSLIFGGATNNWINYGTTGFTTTTNGLMSVLGTRSVGAKIVLYSQISSVIADASIGIDGNTGIWFSTASLGSNALPGNVVSLPPSYAFYTGAASTTTLQFGIGSFGLNTPNRLDITSTTNISANVKRDVNLTYLSSSFLNLGFSGGFATPTAVGVSFADRSLGSRLVIQSANSALISDFAFGVEGAQASASGALWSSLQLNTQSFKWYGGTTLAMTLGGNGDLTLVGSVTMADAKNIILNTTTGTKIGTATSQKLGFWNATPIIQPASANQAAITDSTTGTAGFTLVDVGIVFSQANINNNFASLNRQVDAFRTALVNAGIIKGAA